MAKAKMEQSGSKPLDYNWALDKDFADLVKTNLLSIFQIVQGNRSGREEKWKQAYRAWSIDDSGADKNYEGLADLRVPQLRKEVETMTRRIYKGLTPDDYLTAEPHKAVDQELTTVNTQVVRHYLDNVIRVKTRFLPWIKQGVVYGTSPIRSYWHKEQNEMLYKKRKPVLDADGTINFESKLTKELVTIYDAPKLRTENLFHTYIYPITAETPEDIEITFFETKTQKHFLKMKSDEGTCVGFDEFEGQSEKMGQTFKEEQEKFAQFGDPAESLAVQEETGFFNLLEIQCKLVLPNTRMPVACVVEIINGTWCTRIQRNPYFHQSSPFDWFRYIVAPGGEFYGRGLPEAALSLQNQLDDTMNQTMDSATLSLNAITIINPAYAPNSESFEIEPGATWWADPAAVKQFTFPDLSDTGYKAASSLRQMISEMSDNQPQLPDPIAGKARSTGQADMAMQEWQTDLFTFIDFVSEEALSSMAFKIHLLLQQYLPEDDVIRVAGRYANTWLERFVDPKDIGGHYRFKWIGALQIENRALKTQQMMNLMKVYSQLPPEAQQQIKIIWPNLFTKIVRDGFLIRDIENIVETEDMKSSCPPNIEEKILKQNGTIKVEESDDDVLHLRQHNFDQQNDKDTFTRAVRARHIFDHEKQLEKKRQAAQMAMQQVQNMIAAGAPPEGGQPTPQGPGNRGQIQEPKSQEDMERGMRA